MSYAATPKTLKDIARSNIPLEILAAVLDSFRQTLNRLAVGNPDLRRFAEPYSKQLRQLARRGFDPDGLGVFDTSLTRLDEELFEENTPASETEELNMARGFFNAASLLSGLKIVVRPSCEVIRTKGRRIHYGVISNIGARVSPLVSDAQRRLAWVGYHKEFFGPLSNFTTSAMLGLQEEEQTEQFQSAAERYHLLIRQLIILTKNRQHEQIARKMVIAASCIYLPLATRFCYETAQEQSADCSTNQNPSRSRASDNASRWWPWWPSQRVGASGNGTGKLGFSFVR